jgi:uncharacterized protein (DUF362 family)
MNPKCDRRTFLKGATACSLAATGRIFLEAFLRAVGAGGDALAAETARPVIAVAAYGAPEVMARGAVDALGGMRGFVGKGDVVVVKPNIGWDRTPEQAANTNPDVVKTVVRMCLEAGAKQVKVIDRPCNDPRRCYKQSGIMDAVESLGDPAAVMEHFDPRKFVERKIGNGKSLKSWTFYRDVLEADRIINVPIAKHHGSTRLTMSLKNVMGIIGGNRGNIHHDLDQNIVDLNLVVRWHLIVLDAVRILTANGPQGGRLQDVRRMDTVIAGTDPVAVDSYAATLFGITGHDVPHVLYASQRGLGEIDFKKVKIRKA